MSLGLYNILMILIITTLVLIFSFFITYKYYVKPKRQIRRYLNVCKSLGYSVYQMPFTFLGLSMVTDFEKGLKNHKDSMYAERTIYPQVDLAIGNILDNVFIQFINPDLTKAFLNGKISPSFPKFQLMYRGHKAVLGNGMVFNEGEIWKNKRKLLSKGFNFDLVKGNIPKIIDICNETFAKFQQTNKENDGNNYKCCLLSLATKIFNGVMMKCFFGSEHNNQMIKGHTFEQFVNSTIIDAASMTFNPMIALLGNFAWKAGLTPAIRKAKEDIDLVRQKSAEIIRKIHERVEKQPRKEKTSYLIEYLIYEKLQNKDSISLTDQQLVDEFQTLLAAGTDTTARFFVMMVYYLARNPEKMKRLREDVDAVIKSDQDITFQNLKKLTYIDWCQNEATRMFGPGNGIFPRIAQHDNMINDLPIAKGTIVTYMSRGTHYNPKYFKNPEEFRPERWQSQCDGIHPFAYIGFSAGLRNCIGKQLAYMDSKVALIKLIKQYEIIEAPEEITLKFTFVYQPLPFDVTLTKRANQ